MTNTIAVLSNNITESLAIMKNITEFIKHPIKLKSNRVWRIYSGGKLLDEFCGIYPSTDGAYPEDWLGSVVEANNLPRDGKPLLEGLSMCDDGTGMYLKNLIEDQPEQLLGNEHFKQFGANLGVLVKFLDSAVRLPIQVHPDKKAAKELFHSAYGKTEAWYVLGGRCINDEQPYILMGFQEGVTREQWQQYFDSQDIGKMENSLHKIPVSPGDVFLVRGGTPHAIGPGCFLLEIQEPTDYTISVERKAPDGSSVPDFLCHQGIGFEKMFECFHYFAQSRKKTLESCKLNPVCRLENENITIEHLIGLEQTKAFSLNKMTIRKSYHYPSDGRAAVLAIIGGTGKITYPEGTIWLKQGDSVFMPACMENVSLMSEEKNELIILECLPPALEK